MFPKFGERTVEICHDCKTYTVPKLSILRYCEVLEIVNKSEDTVAGGEQLWKILKTVIPLKIFNCRASFSYFETVELCMHLALGTMLKDVDLNEKQDVSQLPEIPDYQFIAARIMAQFPAYTLEKIMAEPASRFFALAEYAERISADKALGTITAGIRAAFDNIERLRAKRGNMNLPNPHCSPRDIMLARRQEMKDFVSKRQSL